MAAGWNVLIHQSSYLTIEHAHTNFTSVEWPEELTLSLQLSLVGMSLSSVYVCFLLQEIMTSFSQDYLSFPEKCFPITSAKLCSVAQQLLESINTPSQEIGDFHAQFDQKCFFSICYVMYMFFSKLAHLQTVTCNSNVK